MKFMTWWSLKPAHQKQVNTRFLQTGGAPPEGVKMLGRWHGPGTGFVLCETNNAVALYEWTNCWRDLLEFVITPVVEDPDAADAMKRLGR
jgi:hypothetical protein